MAHADPTAAPHARPATRSQPALAVPPVALVPPPTPVAIADGVGVIVERKWDGDRIQAHIMPSGPKKEPDVRLFTRHGKPVHSMYNDVVQGLKSAFVAGDCKGYVLDGELIVVDDEVATL